MKTRTKKLFNAQTVTATVNGAAVDGFGFARRIQSQVVVASIGGTSPSYTAKVQGSYNGTDWFDVPGLAHTAITANGNSAAAVSEIQGTTVTQIPPILRGVLTVSGTTPTAVVTMIVSAEA